MDNVGETLEIRNKPADLQALLKQFDRKDLTTKIGVTEPGERFYRLVTQSQMTKGKIHPTTDNGHYFNYYLDDGNFFGFFTGDKDEWLPFLIRDGFLDTTQDIYEVEIEFPTGTPYVMGKRPTSMEYMENWLDETFIIYDQSVPILKKTKLTEDEIAEAEGDYEDDDDDPDEDDNCSAEYE